MRLSRLLTPVLALIVCAVAVVWSQQPDENYTVALLFPGPVEYFQVQRDAMAIEAERYNLDLQEFDAGWQPSEQIRHLEVAADSGFDLIAIAAVGRDAEEAAVRISTETGVPIIAFTNAFSFGEDSIATFVGRDELHSGELLGEQVSALGRDELRILSVEGPVGVPPTELRAQGFDEVAADNPGWVVVDRLSAEGWALDALADEFRRVDPSMGIDVIVCQWADAAVWVARARDELGLDEVEIVSLEWTEELADHVRSGTVRSSTFSSIREEGRLVIQTVVRLLEGEPVQDFTELDHWIVPDDEVDDVFAEW